MSLHFSTFRCLKVSCSIQGGGLYHALTIYSETKTAFENFKELYKLPNTG